MIITHFRFNSFLKLRKLSRYFPPILTISYGNSNIIFYLKTFNSTINSDREKMALNFYNINKYEKMSGPLILRGIRNIYTQ